jgi:hypothetical protein
MHMKRLAYAAVLAATAAVFAIGSAVPSQAAKKKTAAAPQHMVLCPLEYLPVCATKGGLRQTYANSCFAEHDNATKISKGACGAKKAMHKKKKMSMKKSAKKPMKKTDKK